MKNALDSFAVVRLPYHGIKDTAKCIEVDLSMNRLYVACNAGGVFVWDLVTHQPFALLKHEQWVNAVRCYPPRNTFDAGEEEQYSQSPPIVLTACENGVLSAWCPTTFLIKARVRPGTGPLTDMHIARVEKHTKKFITRGEFLCYVVSLRHVYVIQVLPEFQVLHDLVHEGVVLCLQAHHSLRTQSLLCGQENGCISLWSLSSGRYECTLEYPPDAKDIADDSKIASIHRPSLGEKGAVAHTFTYNKCRSKAQHEKESVRFEDTPLEVVKYIHTMPGELDPFFFKNPVENELLRVSPMGVWQSWFSSSVTMNASASNVGASDSNTFTYDLRRVTCLAAGARDSRKSNRFYSGHGTGEVLIWEVTFPRQPVMLLKKVQVFAFSSWVWRMQAMEVPRTEDPNEPFSADPTKPVFLQLCVWGDSGAVRYMQATGKVVVTDGPGFLATSSFFWRGPQMDLRCGQDTNLQKKLSKSVEKLPSSTVPGEEHPGENASGNASLSSQTSTKTGYYMIMGSFEGRLEIFDVLPIVEKLRHRSW